MSIYIKMLNQYRRAAAKTCILFPKEKLSCSCFVPAVVDFAIFVCVCGFVFCSSASRGVGVLFMWSRILVGSQVASPLAMQGCGLLCAMWFHALVSCAVVCPSCHVKLPSSWEVAFFIMSCGVATFFMSCGVAALCVTWSCHLLPVVELLPSPCLELPPSSCGVAAFFMSCGVTIFSAPCPVESLSVMSSSWHMESHSRHAQLLSSPLCELQESRVIFCHVESPSPV